jgi:HEAT repeat protein
MSILGNYDCNFTIEDIINDFKLGGEPSQFASKLVVQCWGYTVLEPLLMLLNHADANVRRWSAVALGLLESDQAVEPLLEAAEYGEVTVCKEAIRLLGQYRDSRVFSFLVRLLSLETPQHRRKSVRQRVIGALGKQKNIQAVELLILMLKEPESIVRNSAVIALGEIGDTLAVKPLIAALEDMDTNVRFYAAVVLGNLGAAIALPSLLKVSGNDNGKIADGHSVREAATKAIEQISKNI